MLAAGREGAEGGVMQVGIGRWASGESAGVAVIAGDRIYRLASLLPDAEAQAASLPVAIEAGDRLIERLDDATDRADARGIQPEGRLQGGIQAPTGLGLVA